LSQARALEFDQAHPGSLGNPQHARANLFHDAETKTEKQLVAAAAGAGGTDRDHLALRGR